MLSAPHIALALTLAVAPGAGVTPAASARSGPEVQATAGPVPWPWPPSRWMKASPARLNEAMALQRSRPLRERLVALSEGFLHTPYQDSPLGEGQGKDPDPTVRFDAVDCLTFVEETMAMALAPSPEELLPVLTALRYDGPPAYETRNHLMEAQWLPANVRRGYLRDVTRDLGGDDVQPMHKSLTDQSWKTALGRKLDLPVGKRPLGTFVVNVLPLDKVASHLERVPSGTILVVVRADKPERLTRVTHLGFIVRKGKDTYLRHAARSVFKRVVDEDLAKFLQRNTRYDHFPVVGVSFFEVQDPKAKASSVAVGGTHHAKP